MKILPKIFFNQLLLKLVLFLGNFLSILICIILEKNKPVEFEEKSEENANINEKSLTKTDEIPLITYSTPN